VPTLLEAVVFVGFLYKYIMNAAAGLQSFSGVVPFLSLLKKFRTSVVNSVQQYTIISESLEDVVRVKDFLEYSPSEYFAKPGQVMQKNSPTIEVKDLSFAYPDAERNVYENLSIKINAGEKVAIVGENGVGKTTLLKLLLGMYKPQQGEVLIDSTSLFEYASASYYGQLGSLFQSFPTYGALTLRDNVAVGRYSKKIDDTQVIAALKQADAWEFSTKYPLGLDTILSHKYKNGISPSTGQWQKIAIARLFYRNPSFVIFDEPTSSIDAESEYKMFNEIFVSFKEKTVIIVSHRFSTVRQADKIIVLKEGKIVEQGKHSELLALDGVYASAYAKQAEGYK
jgi:ATP-binding cassette subfamily B protein